MMMMANLVDKTMTVWPYFLSPVRRMSRKGKRRKPGHLLTEPLAEATVVRSTMKWPDDDDDDDDDDDE